MSLHVPGKPLQVLDTPFALTVEDALPPHDLSQSVDTYIGMDQSPIKKFPTFLANDLYISGESYAGIYVPYLSW